MDIHALKCGLFSDLDKPMRFLETQGFEITTPTSGRKFGSTVYFENTRGGKWTVTTPACRVVTSQLNTFQGTEHTLHIKCLKKWEIDLKKAAAIAHPLLRPELDFDTFWSIVRKPSFEDIELSTFAYTKKKKKQYINLYSNNEEITGTVQLTPDSIVRANVSIVLTETKYVDGNSNIGFSMKFGAGVRVLTLGGTPPNIKRPWNWDNVNFDTLSMPLYTTLAVKTPALQIRETNGSNIVVADHVEFDAAMNQFHSHSSCPNKWNGHIEVTGRGGRGPIESGSIAIASIEPYRNNNSLHWKTSSLYTSRPKKRVKSEE